MGYAGITSPGNAPSALTVGAFKTFETHDAARDDLMADYSSRGPTWYDAFAKPDVVAPGHRCCRRRPATETLYVELPSQPRSEARTAARRCG